MALSSYVIKSEDIDMFNDFVSSHPKGHVLQSYEWGEIKSKSGWVPIRLIVKRDDKIVGAISVLKRKVPMGRCVFYAPRGPVFDIDDKEVATFLLSEVKKQAKIHKAIYLKIDPDVKIENESWQQFMKDNHFRRAGGGEGFEGVQPRFVFRLDITPDEDMLMKNMHQKTRYNVRLADKKGVTIDPNGTKEHLPAFYDILKTTAERDNFLIRSYSYFEDMYDYLVQNDMGKLFLAYYEGNIISGTLLLNFGEKAWYLYGASSNEHRNVMPNYLIQWEMIKWSKEHGCTMYDFRGVPGLLTEENPLYGLFKFKKGFNGEFTEFIGEYDYIYSKIFYKAYEIFEPMYYKGVRKLIKLKKKLKGN